MNLAPNVLEHLARRRRIPQPVALVVAHPDDETIGAGASLHLFTDMLLVHVTDGAPQSLDDARNAGFGTAAAYAMARRAELAAAIRESSAHPRRVSLDISDQEATQNITMIARRLRDIFAVHRTCAVITHAYEGGHPDHDAVACAVQIAAHAALQVVEFAGYHAGVSGSMQTGAFLTDARDTVTVALSEAEQAIKRRMLACFTTQQRTLAMFGTDQEVFRFAPTYDFSQPPHSGVLNYERFSWGMDGAGWRARALAALEAG